MEEDAMLREASLVQRREMSDHLRASASAEVFWAADDENGQDYRQVVNPTTGHLEATTPSGAMLRQYVHWGETPEANIWARLHRTNVILLIRTSQIDLNMVRPETTHTTMQVYRALSPEEPNIYADPTVVGVQMSPL